MKNYILSLICIIFSVIWGENSVEQHYVYVLKLQPQYHDDKNWSEEDNKIVGQHFMRLLEKMQEGVVIHAGRTMDVKNGFGIVVFKSTSKEKAQDFMNQDPAVIAGIMTAHCEEYSLAAPIKPQKSKIDN